MISFVFQPNRVDVPFGKQRAAAWQTHYTHNELTPEMGLRFTIACS